MPRTPAHQAPKMELCDAVADTLSVAARAGDREACYAILALLTHQIGITLPPPVKTKTRKILTQTLFELLTSEQRRFELRVGKIRECDRARKGSSNEARGSAETSGCNSKESNLEFRRNSDGIPVELRRNSDGTSTSRAHTDTDTDTEFASANCAPARESLPEPDFTPSYLIDDWAAFRMQAHTAGLTEAQLEAWRDYYSAQGWRFKPADTTPMTRTAALASVRNWARAEKRLEIRAMQRRDPAKFAPPPEKGGIDTAALGI